MQMAGFPYNQHHLPYAPDLAYLFPFDQLPPAPTSAQQEAGDDALRALSCLPSYDYPTLDAALQGSLFPYKEIISKVNNGGAGTSSSTSAVVTPISTPNLTPEGSSSFESHDWKLPSADSSRLTTSSSSAGQGGAETKTRRCCQKKRRDALRCKIISESAQSKDPEAGKSRKLRKRSGAKAEEEEKAAPRQIPTGYIHVRARRGEATDSHSLAERVRRERIREKMKMLQDLVPGCDKVVGKALLLEEIINYVRSLQNQVEFLSMKLASMDPWGYDEYGMQFDGYMAQTEWHEADGSEGITMQKLEDMSPGLPNIVQCTGLVQTTAMADETKSHLEYTTPPYLLHDEEGPSCSFPADQDINEGNFVMQVGDPAGQGFLNLIEFDMSFQ